MLRFQFKSLWYKMLLVVAVATLMALSGIGDESRAAPQLPIAPTLRASMLQHATPEPVAPCDGQITYGERRSGQIAVPGAECRFVFQGARGEVVTIRLVKMNDQEDLDPQVELLDPAGKRIANNNNAFDAPNSLINDVVLPETGLYTIVARSYKGQSYGPFRLGLAESRGCGGTLEYGAIDYGAITSRQRVCEYTFRGKKGQRINIQMTSLDNRLDPMLQLINEDGDVIAANDDISDADHNSEIDDYLPRDGVYTIIARAYQDDSAGSFELSLSQIILTTAANEFCTRSLTFGDRVSDRVGSIFGGAYTCHFKFTGRRNDIVTIRMARLDAGLNPYLQLIDPNGAVEIVNNDSGGDGVRLIREHRLRQSGTYEIAAGSYRDETTGMFTLSLTQGQFAIDETVRDVYSGDTLNLRRTPGYRGKPSSDVLVEMPYGATMTILDGPQQADGLTWWAVRYTTYTGWVAESATGGAALLAPSQ